MKNNAANRDVLKITSKEILSLDISDDSAVRQTLHEFVDELLDMPMDLKTEKNFKSFKEKLRGNCPADIQFSSVAPANGVDGEIDQLDNDDVTQSDNDSSNKIDEDGEESVNDDVDGGKSLNNENAEPDKQTTTVDDGESESNDSAIEPPVQTENVEQINNAKNQLISNTTVEPTDNDGNDGTPARETYCTSNEVRILDKFSHQHFSLNKSVSGYCY